ncbi:pentapeptide repeat-containing protein [Yinghuangia seranimata]|uniref:pentapeptide repeat-containing protein n=1 Tax=Yinghuangia seranimata TaxID=408067 RepID=UPI00248CAE1C|nr:pentapeptide repeat-containing protein [Yinghuangia seranimata]MDI2131152.1 pentapeptide repeat-containing protein [Yinghuangia seranimata]
MIVVAWGVLGVVLALAAVLAPLWMVSSTTIPESDRRLELQNSVRGTLLQAAAGTMVLATAVLAYYQLRSSQKQTEIAGTDLDIRIVEQLNSGTPEIRLAGILGLERAAAREPQDLERVLQLLEVFARRSVPLNRSQPTAPEPPPLGVRHPEVQEALRVYTHIRPVLGWSEVTAQHERNIAEQRFDAPTFQLVDLRGADLRYANLQLCDLQSSSMRGANLSRADLLGAQLSGCDLTGAILPFARLGQCTLVLAKADKAFAMNATSGPLTSRRPP